MFVSSVPPKNRERSGKPLECATRIKGQFLYLGGLDLFYDLLIPAAARPMRLCKPPCRWTARGRRATWASKWSPPWADALL